jgi:hypothetical protein
MINSVRNTVLSVLNKNNYGYISPSDFNLFAKQAQLEIFDEYMAKYNEAINMENGLLSRFGVRASGVDYANLRKSIEEAIDVFSVTKFLQHNAGNTFYLPSMLTTNDDYYLINKVLCYTTLLASGNTSNTVLNALFDSTASFISDGIAFGDIVVNMSTGAQATVISVISNDTLLLSSDIFLAFPEGYRVYDRSVVTEAEKVTHGKITMLNNSLLTKPNNTYPAYTQEFDLMSLFPFTIDTQGQVEAQYLRYPKDPKWTYVTILGGEPSFDQSQPDYQDFELPIEDEVALVQKILQYAGMSIRETQVYQYSKVEENEQK